MSGDSVWIWGRHPVLEALRAGRASSVLMAPVRKPAPVLAEIQAQAQRQRVPIREVETSELEAMAQGATVQGVAALVSIVRLESVDSLIESISQTLDQSFILVLDQVQDPHNFGALLRSAEAVGIQAVVVPERRSAPLGGTVAKTSAGALSLLPILEVTNLATTLDVLKRSGIWLVGLDASAGAELFQVDLAIPIALVIGGEGEGLRRLTKEKCDLLVRLPMRGVIESLNASVAGSIAMFECVRQRAKAPQAGR